MTGWNVYDGDEARGGQAVRLRLVYQRASFLLCGITRLLEVLSDCIENSQFSPRCYPFWSSNSPFISAGSTARRRQSNVPSASI